jgi:hypothetical protein
MKCCAAVVAAASWLDDNSLNTRKPMKRTTKINPPFVTLLAMPAAVLACISANAQSSVESFNGYTVGSLLSASTPSPIVAGYTGNWTQVDFGNAGPAVAAGSLVYGGAGYAPGYGDHIATVADSGGIGASNAGRVYRQLDSSLSISSATTGTLYLSWLFQTGNQNAAGNANTYQTLSLYHNTGGANPSGDSAQRIFDAGIAGGDFGTGNYAFRYNNSTVGNLGVAANSNVHLLVAKFTLGATAGSDSIMMWLDPTLGAGDPTGGISINNVDIQFESLALSDYASDSSAWDDIRWGASFNSVTAAPVPEPSTFALAGLGGLALLIRRTQKRA